MAFSFNTKTKLCLDRWAELLGINPLAFNNLSVTNCVEDWTTPCQSWSQDAFQNELNIEQLATFIQSAEQQIESFLGMYAAPTYTYGEVIEIPYFYRREEGKLPIDLLKFQTKWKNIINFGKQKSIYLGSGTVVYTDEDNDGFKETATIILVTDIEVEDTCAIELNVCGTENCNSFCPIRKIDFNAIDSTLTIVTDTWLLRKPELIKTGFMPRPKYLDACNLNNFLDCVGIYYNIKDSCKADVEIVWNKKEDCKGGNCEEIVFPACAFLLDDCYGIFQIQPMQYNTETNCIETFSNFCNWPCYPPDFIRVNYNSGCLNSYKHANCSNCKICDKLERAIAILAATLLPQNYCNCSCLNGLLQYYQTDSAVKAQGIVNYNLPFDLMNNPFGTKLGQIEAYRIVLSVLNDICN